MTLVDCYEELLLTPACRFLCEHVLSTPLSIYMFYATYGDLLIFRERRRDKERERNFHVWLPLIRPLPGTWPTTRACALTGNGTGDPWVRRPALSPLSHPSQDSRESFEELPNYFPQWPHHFTFPLALHEGSNFSTSSPTPGIFCLLRHFTLAILSGGGKVTRDFGLHFPNDECC